MRTTSGPRGRRDCRSGRYRQARAALHAHPDPHDLRPGPRPAARRRGAHREHVLAARHRQVLGGRDRQQRPAEGARRDLDRGASSSSSPTWSWTCSTPSSTRGCGPDERAGIHPTVAHGPAVPPSSRSATCGCTSPPTTAWSGRSTGSRSPCERGQTAGHRRGVRLGQERDQPVDHGPARAAGGRRSSGEIWLDGEELVGATPEQVRKLRGTEDGDDLPGPAVRDAPVLHGRRADHRGVPDAHRRQQGRGPPARDRAARTGWASRSRRRGSTTTRTSSPAACGSGR